MAKLVHKSHKEDQSWLPNTRRMAALAAERKAKNIRAYDVRGLTLIADAFLVCTASSEPQAKAIYNSAKNGMAEIGLKPIRTEGKPGSGWLVLDYGTIIFHIFRSEAREFYDLDGLWGDAPLVDLDLDPEE